MYKFAAAWENEQIVFGSARPGYSGKNVKQWIEFMQNQGIKRVCCLLSQTQLNQYTDLLDVYREAFGKEQICWTPIEDFQLADKVTLTTQILPFLAIANQQNQKVVVHCSGGIGRTGHILAAWLVSKRGLSNQQAISFAIKTGRNPYEAVIAGALKGQNPIKIVTELNALLDECRRIGEMLV